MKKNRILRGDIYYANLNPVRGSEQGGIRPVLIIQNNTGNYFATTVIVAPISTKKPKLPTHIKLPSTDKLKHNSVILFEQIRTIDKRRLISYLGSIPKSLFLDVNKSICCSLGINNNVGIFIWKGI